MEALCKVVTGERNDFIFHFDNWMKQIPGSSARFYAHIVTQGICLATKRCCKERKSRFFFQWKFVTEMLKRREEREGSSDLGFLLTPWSSERPA